MARNSTLRQSSPSVIDSELRVDHGFPHCIRVYLRCSARERPIPGWIRSVNSILMHRGHTSGASQRPKPCPTGQARNSHWQRR